MPITPSPEPSYAGAGVNWKGRYPIWREKPVQARPPHTPPTKYK